MDIQKLALPASIAAILVLAFAYLGGTIQLGAHPFWSVQVAYIGIGVGLVVLFAAHLLGLAKARQIVLFGIGLIIAVAVAKYGKNGFAASYAEDRFAGKLWYYGWIATCSMAFSFLAAVNLSARKQ